MYEEFLASFDKVQKESHSIATKRGYWDMDRHDCELLILIHSEISEALEALRRGNKKCKLGGLEKFKEIEIELADAVIRIMDMAEARGYHLSDAIIKKNLYNKLRISSVVDKHRKLF